MQKKSKLIQPTNIESVSFQDAKVTREVVEVQSAFVVNIQNKIKSNPAIMQELEAQAEKAISLLITEDTPSDVKEATIKSKTDEYVEVLAKQEISKISFDEHHQHKTMPQAAELFPEGSLFNMFSDSAKEELAGIGRIAAQTMEVRNIPIPRLMLTPHYGELVIENFDLNAKKLTKYTTGASIIEERLQGSTEKDLLGEARSDVRDAEYTRVLSFGEGRKQSPENTIISGLLDHPLVDYEEQRDLLLKLSKQAVAHYKTFVSDESSLKMMIENNYRQIAKEIYDQILVHKRYVAESYLESEVREPKPYLEQYNFSQSADEKPVTLESQLDRFPREKIYTGFRKACHDKYRFDSSDEGRLAYLVDREPTVEDWLRPAPSQFEGLFWRDESGDSQHRYEPDFVVEFKDEIVMIEVKPSGEINTPDVQAKKKTAEKYCELVSKNVGSYGIVKPWRYIIVPTEKISITFTVAGLIAG